MRFARSLCSLLILLSLTSGGRVLAEQPLQVEQIEAFLKQPILASGTTLAETRALVDASVPTMPAVQSLDAWEAEAARLRREVLERVVFRGEASRWRDAELGVEWAGEIVGGPGYRIRKLRYEALPGLWIPALLYEPTDLGSRNPDSDVNDRRPVVLNVNGHDGNGKAADYKQIRCINLVKRGLVVLNVEWLGMGQLRGDGYGHSLMNQLDLCGTSGLAPFYLSLSRGLDVLLAHDHADPERVAVAGLSGGGWQTIAISSLDTRVSLANPVAGYSSFLTRNQHTKDLGDSEQTPTDLATIADYTHLTAMMAPRATLLTYNTDDNCCFEAGYALPPLVSAAKPIFQLHGRPDRLQTHRSDDPGDHNFAKDNREALYRMIGEHFYPDDSAFVVQEIASDDEVKSAEQLSVPLPDTNASFNTLATELAVSLPREAALPPSPEALGPWQAERRERLREIVRWQSYDAQAEVVGSENLAGVTATRMRLKLGDTWTLAAVDLMPQEHQDQKQQGQTAAVLMVSAGGLASLSQQVTDRLALGERVFLVDPFYFGESKFPSHDYLQALLVATIGQRPIGIQASQVAAVANWLRDRDQIPPSLVALDHRSSLFALIAAAMEPDAISGLTLEGSRASLKEVIERNEAVTSAPELFCFGLLKHFDTPQLAALVAPRPLAFIGATQRHRTVLAPLVNLYEQLDGELQLP